MINKIKRPVSIVLVVMMVVSLFTIVPISASAATITSDTNVNDLSVGDILTSEICDLYELDSYTLTLSANGFGTDEAVINTDMVFDHERHIGFSNGTVFVEGEEPYRPYVKGEKVEQWIVTAIDHDEETITLTGYAEPTTEEPEAIKDCTYQKADSAIFANVPFKPADASDYSSLVDGAIFFAQISSGMIRLVDAKGYSYKFYDQTGTEIAAELSNSSDMSGSRFGLSDDVTVYAKYFDIRIPDNLGGLYIVATAPTEPTTEPATEAPTEPTTEAPTEAPTTAPVEETITVNSGTDKLSNHGIQNLHYGDHFDFNGNGLPWGTFVAPTGKVFTKIVTNGTDDAMNWTGSAERVDHDGMMGEWYIDFDTDEDGFLSKPMRM